MPPGAQENPSLAPLVSPARPTHKLNRHKRKDREPGPGFAHLIRRSAEETQRIAAPIDGISDGISLAGALRGTSAHRNKGIGGVGRTGETGTGQRGSFAK